MAGMRDFVRATRASNYLRENPNIFDPRIGGGFSSVEEMEEQERIQVERARERRRQQLIDDKHKEENVPWYESLARAASKDMGQAFDRIGETLRFGAANLGFPGMASGRDPKHRQDIAQGLGLQPSDEELANRDFVDRSTYQAMQESMRLGMDKKRSIWQQSDQIFGYGQDINTEKLLYGLSMGALVREGDNIFRVYGDGKRETLPLASINQSGEIKQALFDEYDVPKDVSPMRTRAMMPTFRNLTPEEFTKKARKYTTQALEKEGWDTGFKSRLLESPLLQLKKNMQNLVSGGRGESMGTPMHSYIGKPDGEFNAGANWGVMANRAGQAIGTTIVGAAAGATPLLAGALGGATMTPEHWGKYGVGKETVGTAAFKTASDVITSAMGVKIGSDVIRKHAGNMLLKGRGLRGIAAMIGEGVYRQLPADFVAAVTPMAMDMVRTRQSPTPAAAVTELGLSMFYMAVAGMAFDVFSPASLSANVGGKHVSAWKNIMRHGKVYRPAQKIFNYAMEHAPKKVVKADGRPGYEFTPDQLAKEMTKGGVIKPESEQIAKDMVKAIRKIPNLDPKGELKIQMKNDGAIEVHLPERMPPTIEEVRAKSAARSAGDIPDIQKLPTAESVDMEGRVSNKWETDTETGKAYTEEYVTDVNKTIRELAERNKGSDVGKAAKEVSEKLSQDGPLKSEKEMTEKGVIQSAQNTTAVFKAVTGQKSVDGMSPVDIAELVVRAQKGEADVQGYNRQEMAHQKNYIENKERLELSKDPKDRDLAAINEVVARAERGKYYSELKSEAMSRNGNDAVMAEKEIAERFGIESKDVTQIKKKFLDKTDGYTKDTMEASWRGQEEGGILPAKPKQKTKLESTKSAEPQVKKTRQKTKRAKVESPEDVKARLEEESIKLKEEVKKHKSIVETIEKLPVKKAVKGGESPATIKRKPKKKAPKKKAVDVDTPEVLQKKYEVSKRESAEMKAAYSKMKKSVRESAEGIELEKAIKSEEKIRDDLKKRIGVEVEKEVVEDRKTNIRRKAIDKKAQSAAKAKETEAAKEVQIHQKALKTADELPVTNDPVKTRKAKDPEILQPEKAEAIKAKSYGEIPVVMANADKPVFKQHADMADVMHSLETLGNPKIDGLEYKGEYGENMTILADEGVKIKQSLIDAGVDKDIVNKIKVTQSRGREEARVTASNKTLNRLRQHTATQQREATKQTMTALAMMTAGAGMENTEFFEDYPTLAKMLIYGGGGLALSLGVRGIYKRALLSPMTDRYAYAKLTPTDYRNMPLARRMRLAKEGRIDEVMSSIRGSAEVQSKPRGPERKAKVNEIKEYYDWQRKMEISRLKVGKVMVYDQKAHPKFGRMPARDIAAQTALASLDIENAWRRVTSAETPLRKVATTDEIVIMDAASRKINEDYHAIESRKKYSDKELATGKKNVSEDERQAEIDKVLSRDNKIEEIKTASEMVDGVKPLTQEQAAKLHDAAWEKNRAVHNAMTMTKAEAEVTQATGVRPKDFESEKIKIREKIAEVKKAQKKFNDDVKKLEKKKEITEEDRSEILRRAKELDPLDLDYLKRRLETIESAGRSRDVTADLEASKKRIAELEEKLLTAKPAKRGKAGEEGTKGQLSREIAAEKKNYKRIEKEGKPTKLDMSIESQYVDLWGGVRGQGNVAIHIREVEFGNKLPQSTDIAADISISAKRIAELEKRLSTAKSAKAGKAGEKGTKGWLTKEIAAEKKNYNKIKKEGSPTKRIPREYKDKHPYTEDANTVKELWRYKDEYEATLAWNDTKRLRNAKSILDEAGNKTELYEIDAIDRYGRTIGEDGKPVSETGNSPLRKKVRMKKIVQSEKNAVNATSRQMLEKSLHNIIRAGRIGGMSKADIRGINADVERIARIADDLERIKVDELSGDTDAINNTIDMANEVRLLAEQTGAQGETIAQLKKVLDQMVLPRITQWRQTTGHKGALPANAKEWRKWRLEITGRTRSRVQKAFQNGLMKHEIDRQLFDYYSKGLYGNYVDFLLDMRNRLNDPPPDEGNFFATGTVKLNRRVGRSGEKAEQRIELGKGVNYAVGWAATGVLAGVPMAGIRNRAQGRISTFLQGSIMYGIPKTIKYMHKAIYHTKKAAVSNVLEMSGKGLKKLEAFEKMDPLTWAAKRKALEPLAKSPEARKIWNMHIEGATSGENFVRQVEMGSAKGDAVRDKLLFLTIGAEWSNRMESATTAAYALMEQVPLAVAKKNGISEAQWLEDIYIDSRAFSEMTQGRFTATDKGPIEYRIAKNRFGHNFMTFMSPQLKELQVWAGAWKRAIEGGPQAKKAISALFAAYIMADLMGGEKAMYGFGDLMDAIGFIDEAANGDIDMDNVRVKTKFIEQGWTEMATLANDKFGTEYKTFEALRTGFQHGIMSAFTGYKFSWDNTYNSMTEPFSVSFGTKALKNMKVTDADLITAIAAPMMQSFMPVEPRHIVYAGIQKFTNTHVDKNFNKMRDGYGWGDFAGRVFFGRHIEDVKATNRMYEENLPTATSEQRRNLVKKYVKTPGVKMTVPGILQAGVQQILIDSPLADIAEAMKANATIDWRRSPLQDDVSHSMNKVEKWMETDEGKKKKYQISQGSPESYPQFGVNKTLPAIEKRIKKYVTEYYTAGVIAQTLKNAMNGIQLKSKKVTIDKISIALPFGDRVYKRKKVADYPLEEQGWAYAMTRIEIGKEILRKIEEEDWDKKRRKRRKIKGRFNQ